MEQEKILVAGVYTKKREGSPAFVVSSVSVKVPDFIAFLNKHQNNAGYVDFDILLSQKGTQYAQLNTWQPKKEETTKTAQEIDNERPNETVIDPSDGRELNPDQIPF